MKNKEELEKKTGVKRFDICLMNPPYSQRHNNNPIHFQFVEKVLGIAEKQIVIMPSRILHTTSENYNIWKEKFDKTLLSAEELKSDVRNYIKEVASDYMDCEDMDELRDSLYDNLWDEDSVTGNGSGSYTFNREKAKEYVSDNMDLMEEAYKDLDSIESLVDDLEALDFETIDVTIRCYLLSQALDEVLEDGDFLKKVGIDKAFGFIGDDY